MGAKYLDLVVYFKKQKILTKYFSSTLGLINTCILSSFKKSLQKQILIAKKNLTKFSYNKIPISQTPFHIFTLVNKYLLNGLVFYVSSNILTSLQIVSLV